MEFAGKQSKEGSSNMPSKKKEKKRKKINCKI